MRDRIVLVLAEKDGQPVAGALNLKGPQALYGRNWGCLEDYRFLHFELCYYRAIDYAIAHKLPRVEAGAQGEHKIQRGYLPTETYSSHWIADPRLKAAISDFLDRERAYIAQEKAALDEMSPYRQVGSSDPLVDRLNKLSAMANAMRSTHAHDRYHCKLRPHPRPPVNLATPFSTSTLYWTPRSRLPWLNMPPNHLPHGPIVEPRERQDIAAPLVRKTPCRAYSRRGTRRSKRCPIGYLHWPALCSDDPRLWPGTSATP